MLSRRLRRRPHGPPRAARAGLRERGGLAHAVRFALFALLEALSAQPALGRLLLLEPLRADHEAIDRYQAGLEELARMLAASAPEPRDAGLPSDLLAEFLACGVAFHLARSLHGGRRDLRPLLPELAAFVLTPYRPLGRPRLLGEPAKGGADRPPQADFSEPLPDWSSADYGGRYGEQRRRFLAALASNGYHSTTVAHLLEGSGLSRPIFYAHFKKSESSSAGTDGPTCRYRRRSSARPRCRSSTSPSTLRVGN